MRAARGDACSPTRRFLARLASFHGSIICHSLIVCCHICDTVTCLSSDPREVHNLACRPAGTVPSLAHLRSFASRPFSLPDGPGKELWFDNPPFTHRVFPYMPHSNHRSCSDRRPPGNAFFPSPPASGRRASFHGSIICHSPIVCSHICDTITCLSIPRERYTLP